MRAWAGQRALYSAVSIPEAPLLSRRPSSEAPSEAPAPGPAARLVYMLNSAQAVAPDMLWDLYCQALDERPYVCADGTVRQPQRLAPADHQRVLQALVPPRRTYVAYLQTRDQVRKVRDDAHLDEQVLEALATDASAIDLSTPQALAPLPPVRGMGGRVAQTLTARVRTVLGQIPLEHRTTGAYNRVLAVLALGGRYKNMRLLWDDMVAARAAGYAQAAPNQTTCHHMIIGLVRNFEQKLTRYKKKYRRELLAPAHQRHKVKHRLEAAEHVQASADLAASTVSMLLVDIYVQGTVPRVLTLDLAARLLRATGKLPELLNLLRSGFGIDLENPDTAAPALCAPTTHTLNTVLMALGELARAPDMAVAYEQMTRALPGDDRRHAVLPNSTTFKLLIRHAMSVPETLLVSNASIQAPRSLLARLSSGPQSTPTIGIRTNEQRDDEMLARSRGKYRALARAYLDEALDMYAAQLEQMATLLGVPIPSGLHASLDEVHARACERRASEAPSDAAWQDEALGSASPCPTRPVFLPPRVRPSVPLLRPLLAAAQQQRSTGQLVWLQQRADRAGALLAAELAILSRAQASLGAEHAALQPTLRAHIEYVQPLWEGIVALGDGRVPRDLDAWREAERQRNARRAARATTRKSRRSGRSARSGDRTL
ncbi:hypothetical protein MCAP1_000262 [Malassezia caprae]|uniref:Uncharacterized protein n=1 Tax=Malassezia caprae TaxID=1381934 RepID=A0AAF0E330_9BASI|nr:hypothetical protein MCAP1_000262 [Malassezia caprae]